MKRKTAGCLLLVLCLLLFCSCAGTMPKEDSLFVPEEHLLLMEERCESCTEHPFIKVWEGGFLTAISKNDSIDDFHLDAAQPLYYWHNIGHFPQYAYVLENDGGLELDFRPYTISSFESKLCERMLNAVINYEELFATRLTVEEMEQLRIDECYCLSGAWIEEGIIVWFVSNYGEYIYYDPAIYADERAHFMSLEVFRELVAADQAAQVPSNADGYTHGVLLEAIKPYAENVLEWIDELIKDLQANQ